MEGGVQRLPYSKAERLRACACRAERRSAMAECHSALRPAESCSSLQLAECQWAHGAPIANWHHTAFRIEQTSFPLSVRWRLNALDATLESA